MTRRIPLVLVLTAGLGPLNVWAQEVAGRVAEDSSGSPLASAELKFRKAGMRELAADLETDREGRFHASGLAAGEYSVEVSKPNFVTANLKVTVPATALTLRLVRYGIITGKALDTQSQPLAGRLLAPGGRTSGSARVVVLVKSPGSASLEAVRQVPLGEGGRYRIFDLPPGQYALGLWWAGLPVGSGAQLYPDSAHPKWFTVSGGEDYRDIDFLVVSGPSFSVIGKVELPKPNTIASVALGLPDQPALPVGQMVAEPDGSFRFDKISPGTYDLFVATPANAYRAFESVLGRDPQFARMKIQVVGQNVESISVPLNPARAVDVVLKPWGGEQPPEACPQNASVSAELLEPWGILSTGQSRAGFDKPQTIHDLAPSRYRLTLGGLGAGCYQVNWPEVDLSRETGGPVVIEVAAAGSLHGSLRTGSTPAKDFVVVLVEGAVPVGEGFPVQVAFPDEQGRFQIDGLRPGHYRIAAQPASARARWVANVSQMTEVDVAGGAPTVLELPVSAPKGGGQ